MRIPDLRQVTDIHLKKQRFFAALRPMVEAENQRILDQRNTVLTLQLKSSLSTKERHIIQSLRHDYRLNTAPSSPIPWQALRNHIDTLPLALVMVQAANESAWGTSRFARLGNNLFGEWCFHQGCGIVPARRNLGSTHEVTAFASPQLSVRSYLHNINTGRAYAKLRIIRAQQRNQNQSASATQLANGLAHYSQRGQAYVHEIKAMLRHNQQYLQ